MPSLEDAKKHYKLNPPQLDFNETEGSPISYNTFDKLNDAEKAKIELDESNVIHIIHQNANNPVPTSDKIFFVVKFDKFSREIPTHIPLPPQMKGHELHITLYLDTLGFVNMLAIGNGK